MTDPKHGELEGLGPEPDLADALPEDEEESTGAIRITEVQRVDPRLVPRDRATLSILSGPETGRVFSLDKAPVLGRGKDCDIQIDDNSVSRSHARIVLRGALRWVLEDLGSRNGSFVNGKNVKSHELQDGDIIQLGASVRFRFAIANVEEESVLRKLYESSVRDGLTGAFNRRHFNDRLVAEISYAVRHGTELALLMFDIDHFKRVNDNYGHLAGDRILSKLTSVMQHTVRAEDILARYGGEEFAVIARGTDAGGARSLADRIRGISERVTVRFEGIDLRVTVSVGVAMLSDVEGKEPGQFIGRADANLYAAKQSGRNCVVGPG